MSFRSIYDQGFARVAAVSLPVHLAQPQRNAAEIIDASTECAGLGVALVVFPELSLSGYSVDDLFFQDVLLDDVRAALAQIVSASRNLLPVLIVGAPLAHDNRLFNCAVTIHRGRVLAVTPKLHLPTYREFYEKRHFAVPDFSTSRVMKREPWQLCDGIDRDRGASPVPFGPHIVDVADVPGLAISPEICEDMWVPVPPSSLASLAGASVIANLSASPITVGRAEDRSLLVRSGSSRTNSTVVYCAAGAGESSTDLSWDGQTLICEMGEMLAEGERFPRERSIITADVDLDRMRQERLRQGSFNDNRVLLGAATQSMPDRSDLTSSLMWPTHVSITLNPPRTDIGFHRHVDRFPFVPDDKERLTQDCYEAYNIQVSGLEQRIRAIGAPKLVIGVSGGLDSTHALIVAAKAMDRLGRPRQDILAYTLPGFATTEHTKSNATKLCEHLGVSFEKIDITPAARQMLADLHHPYASGSADYDVTFENVQAGLRTDYLFRLANHLGGIVVGTGDLSELALGWCTYGVGDQMSHYAVNCGVPKTMIQHLIRWVVASGQFDESVNEVLMSILDTEITPELVPTKPGEKPQSTEDSIGPYALQDFTLFHVLRRGYRPSKIAFLAEKAWADSEAGDWPPGYPVDDRTAYSLDEILHWERLFIRRFFSNQFKRTAIPNGPKVMAGGSLSPRGDWRMPSDASGATWLAELDTALEQDQ